MTSLLLSRWIAVLPLFVFTTDRIVKREIPMTAAESSYAFGSTGE
jgi:hypothetical protein